MKNWTTGSTASMMNGLFNAWTVADLRSLSSASALYFVSPVKLLSRRALYFNKAGASVSGMNKATARKAKPFQIAQI